MPVIIDEVIADVPATPVQAAAERPSSQQTVPPVAQDMLRLLENNNSAKNACRWINSNGDS